MRRNMPASRESRSPRSEASRYVPKTRLPSRIRAIETLLEILAIAKHSAEDTAAEDTAAEDTAAEDTAAEDTAAEDTAAEDTAAEDTAAEDEAIGDWQGLRKGARDIHEAFAGLFAADELSYVRLFVDILERAGDEPDKASRWRYRHRATGSRRSSAKG